MKIYVQSRGIAQENDYRWLRIKPDSTCRLEIPSILKKNIPINASFSTTIPDLIDSQKPSIVLVESDHEFLLLVTGLPTRGERTDFVGRKVRNSVAWIRLYANELERIESEQLMRKLAVCALREELAEQVDRAITIGGEHGFEVSWEALSRLTESLDIRALEPEEKAKASSNTPQHRIELALELEQYSLPQVNKHRILVLVTSIKSQDALEKVCVWRGLSNRIESNDWVDLGNSSTYGLEATWATEQGSKKNINWLILGILVAAVILVVILLVTPLWRSEPEPTPKAIPQELQMPSKEESIQLINSEKPSVVTY